MAGVEVTITGMLYDKLNRTTQNVVLIGEATLTGLGVGGGPIIPPGPGNPPGIWGPNDPRPTPPIANVPPGSNPNPPGWGLRPEHPIVLPPAPIVPPPSIWPPGPGIDFPSHPIVLPPPVGGGEPIIPPGTLVTWKPVWTPDTGWMVIGVPNIPHPVPSA